MEDKECSLGGQTLMLEESQQTSILPQWSFEATGMLFKVPTIKKGCPKGHPLKTTLKKKRLTEDA